MEASPQGPRPELGPILVTGAAGGLGSVVTAHLLAVGYTVVAVDRSIQSLQRLADRLEHPSLLHVLTADVTSAPGTRSLFEELETAYDTPQAVVHLVGGYHGGARIDETSDDDFERMLNLNLRSSFYVLREALQVLRPLGRGSIVLIGSVAAGSGMVPPGAGAYAASKAGLAALVEAAAAENKGWGVRINALLPGQIRTPANVASMPQAEHYKWVEPEELAELIGFLVSPVASGLQGALIKVTGRL